MTAARTSKIISIVGNNLAVNIIDPVDFNLGTFSFFISRQWVRRSVIENPGPFPGDRFQASQGIDGFSYRVDMGVVFDGQDDLAHACLDDVFPPCLRPCAPEQSKGADRELGSASAADAADRDGPSGLGRVNRKIVLVPVPAAHGVRPAGKRVADRQAVGFDIVGGTVFYGPKSAEDVIARPPDPGELKSAAKLLR